MLNHEQLKQQALAAPETREAYEQVNRDEFALLDFLLELRHASGLSQAEVAQRMGTRPPDVARLESALATGKHSPTLSTLRKYVRACGKELDVSIK